MSTINCSFFKDWSSHVQKWLKNKQTNKNASIRITSSENMLLHYSFRAEHLYLPGYLLLNYQPRAFSLQLAVRPATPCLCAKSLELLKTKLALPCYYLWPSSFRLAHPSLCIFFCFWQDPMTFIDLKRCITEKVGLVPRDVCARPNTFEMTTVRQPLKGEHDTLISRTHNSTTLVRLDFKISSLSL